MTNCSEEFGQKDDRTAEFPRCGMRDRARQTPASQLHRSALAEKSGAAKRFSDRRERPPLTRGPSVDEALKPRLIPAASPVVRLQRRREGGVKSLLLFGWLLRRSFLLHGALHFGFGYSLGTGLLLSWHNSPPLQGLCCWTSAQNCI